MDAKKVCLAHGIDLKDELENGPWPTFIKIIKDKTLDMEKIDTSCIDVNTPTISDLVRIGSVREYSKYEFCKAMKCQGLENKNKVCRADNDCCPFTAKEFHHWLKDDGFEIVKKVK